MLLASLAESKHLAEQQEEALDNAALVAEHQQSALDEAQGQAAAQAEELDSLKAALTVCLPCTFSVLTNQLSQIGLSGCHQAGGAAAEGTR